MNGLAKKTATLVASAAIALTLNACSSDDSSDNNSSGGGGGGLGKVDCAYEGGAVTIGDQTWMAENLNCNVAGSMCYDNNQANCDKYGRLYNWATAMNLPDSCNTSRCSSKISTKHKGICPSGWHIPTKEEWDILTSYIENDKECGGCDAKHLKATSGWNSCGASGSGSYYSCEDSYKFAALPGGEGYSGGIFYNNVGDLGIWWSATEDRASDAFYLYMDYDYENAYWSKYFVKSYLRSIRCLQD